MRKYLLLLLTAITIIAADKAYALEMTVGATTWYVWGNRNEDIISSVDPVSGQQWSYRYGNNNSYSFDPSFLYGPAISIKFNNDFNLTFIYLYGKFEHNITYDRTYGDTWEANYKFKRSDSDIALNYRLNDFFKVFAGIKYMNYDIKITETSPSGVEEDHNSSSKHRSFGPGLGLSSTYPLTENIFLLGTISGFYLFTTGEKFKDGGEAGGIYGNYGDGGLEPVNWNIGYKEYGINTTLAVAYYIAPASIVISLGGRFQYFKTDYDEKRNDDDPDPRSAADKDNFLINSITNKMYGITLTATYSFSI